MDNFLQAIGAGVLFGGVTGVAFYISFFLATYFQFKKETETKLKNIAFTLENQRKDIDELSNRMDDEGGV